MKEFEIYKDNNAKDSILNDSHTYLFCKNKIKMDIGKSWRIPTKRELINMFKHGDLQKLRVYWTNKQLRIIFTSDAKCIYVKSDDEYPLAWVMPVKTINDLRKTPLKLRPMNRILKPKKTKKMNKQKVNQLDDNTLLNNPNIKFSKTQEDYVNTKGIVRKNWTLEQEIFLLKNIHKGHKYLSKKLNKSPHTLRLKFGSLLGGGVFTLKQKSGEIFWDKLNQKEPKVSKPKGRPRKKKELSQHEYDTYDAQVVDTLHVGLNNVDEIHHLRNEVAKLTNQMKKYHNLYNDEILRVTNSLQADINKNYERTKTESNHIYNEIRKDINDIDTAINKELYEMNTNIQETFDKVSDHIHDVLEGNEPKSKRLKVSIKLVKGFGLGFGYQNYDDKKFGISIGPLVINMWRE